MFISNLITNYLKTMIWLKRNLILKCYPGSFDVESGKGRKPVFNPINKEYYYL